MEKQIVEINQDGFCLSLFRGFLVVENRELQINQNVPLDNVLALVLSANNVVVSKNIINALCENGCIVVFCNQSYLPSAITFPYVGHWLIAPRIKQQIGSSLPFQKNLWKNIVQHKIINQAKILEKFFPEHQALARLRWLSKDVLSNDSRNNEGQAAGIYFKSLFGKNFVRDRLNSDINILLNYGYTVLRAMVARAIAGNGLLPYLGIKHCNKSNPLPLVDDLIEPFRAVVDKTVFEEINKLVNIEQIELTPEIKRNITKIITYPVQTEKGCVSLNDAIYDFVASLVTSYETKQINLRYAEL